MAVYIQNIYSVQMGNFNMYPVNRILGESTQSNDKCTLIKAVGIHVV